MSGLFALLDDVAALVRITAASLDDIAGAAGRAGIKADTVKPTSTQAITQLRELGLTPILLTDAVDTPTSAATSSSRGLLTAPVTRRIVHSIKAL